MLLRQPMGKLDLLHLLRLKVMVFEFGLLAFISNNGYEFLCLLVGVSVGAVGLMDPAKMS